LTTKLLVLSDSGTPSGYGRIADETMTRLAKRGIDVFMASLGYDGLLPPSMDSVRLPYWVASLAGKPWLDEFTKLVGPTDPSFIVVIQDAPYVEAVRNLPLDWSQIGFMAITPVDGVPIYPRWVQTLGSADAAMCISEFGVAAYRKAGVPVNLCRPGVDPNVFFRKPDADRAAIRAQLGLQPGQFIVGTMAMNQGRKAISLMLKAFFEFAADKPDARYLLDMEAQSPAGWDIPALCDQFGWDKARLIFRADAVRAGVVKLADRYNVLDAHMVISHREGYGLPLAEAMACGAVSVAMDYCSGAEIVGQGRGVLIPCAPGVEEPGTWGGALDKWPDMAALVKGLDDLYRNPIERAAMAQRGQEWARSHTWDETANAVYDTLMHAVAKRAAWGQTAEVAA
jgi:glycosyltransferase involved in cell wall biosynthesis